jgi:predicted TPR repeat methyltransferase
LIKNNLSKSARFLDLGCGTLRGGIPIIKYLDTNCYTGIDIRENVIHEARKELMKHRLQVKNPDVRSFGTFDEIQFDQKFDVVFSFSVLIHMTDPVLEECFNFIYQWMNQAGVFYANVNIGVQDDRQWQEFPITFRDLLFYSTIAAKCGLEMESMGPLAQWGHHTGDSLQDAQQMLKFTKII